MSHLDRGIYLSLRRVVLIVCLIALMPPLARADAGVPMLPLAYPVILVFLAFVILIEAVYVRRRLKSAWWRTLGGTAIANGITMLLGYPLMWLIYLIAELALFSVLSLASKPLHLDSIPNNFAMRLMGTILGAAWMGPRPGQEYWPVLVAFLTLLVPSFFISGWIEAKFLTGPQWLGTGSNSAKIVWQANILSYIFLAIAGCLLLSYQLSHHLGFAF
ncbi:MAG TPA: hypothetical protein VFW25_13110 [Silvibacterium sp.]|nr:hypothetical protein [Silvibacterium sp.]